MLDAELRVGHSLSVVFHPGSLALAGHLAAVVHLINGTSDVGQGHGHTSDVGQGRGQTSDVSQSYGQTSDVGQGRGHTSDVGQGHGHMISQIWVKVTANGSKALRARKIRRREWGGEVREGERETQSLYFRTESVYLFSSSK